MENYLSLPQLLKFLRRTVPSIPLSRHIMPVFAHVPDRHKIQSTLPPLSDPISVTRTFCGALFFPTVATFLGSSMYPDVQGRRALESPIRNGNVNGDTFLWLTARRWGKILLFLPAAKPTGLVEASCLLSFFLNLLL